MPYSATRSRRLGCLVLFALAAGALLSAFAWVAGGPYTSAFPRPFDSARWKAADTNGGTRCGMIADLTYRIGVEGKSQAELTQMLGKPDDEVGDPGRSRWLLCPSFMDIYILEVEWDKGRAVTAVVRDT